MSKTPKREPFGLGVTFLVLGGLVLLLAFKLQQSISQGEDAFNLFWPLSIIMIISGIVIIQPYIKKEIDANKAKKLNNRKAESPSQETEKQEIKKGEFSKMKKNKLAELKSKRSDCYIWICINAVALIAVTLIGALFNARALWIIISIFIYTPVFIAEIILVASYFDLGKKIEDEKKAQLIEEKKIEQPEQPKQEAKEEAPKKSESANRSPNEYSLALFNENCILKQKNEDLAKSIENVKKENANLFEEQRATIEGLRYENSCLKKLAQGRTNEVHYSFFENNVEENVTVGRKKDLAIFQNLANEMLFSVCSAESKFAPAFNYDSPSLFKESENTDFVNLQRGWEQEIEETLIRFVKSNLLYGIGNELFNIFKTYEGMSSFNAEKAISFIASTMAETYKEMAIWEINPHAKKSDFLDAHKSDYGVNAIRLLFLRYKMFEIVMKDKQIVNAFDFLYQSTGGNQAMAYDYISMKMGGILYKNAELNTFLQRSNIVFFEDVLSSTVPRIDRKVQLTAKMYEYYYCSQKQLKLWSDEFWRKEIEKASESGIYTWIYKIDYEFYTKNQYRYGILAEIDSFIDAIIYESGNCYTLKDLLTRICERKEVKDQLAHITQKAKLNIESKKRKGSSKIPNETNFDKFKLALQEMSPRNFEIFAGDLFMALGYDSIVTPYVSDNGCDVIATKDDVKIVVQCKHTARENSISADAIREAYAAKSYHNADKAIVFTNGKIAPNSIRFAEHLRVSVWDIDYIFEKSSKAGVTIYECKEGE